jgi:hypothetical protein
MDLGEIGLGSVGWIRLTQDMEPVAGCCECDDEPSGSCATELVKRSKHFHYFSAVYFKNNPGEGRIMYIFVFVFICSVKEPYALKTEDKQV